MNILYSKNPTGVDYLSDSILDGLKRIINVVDVPRQWHIYKKEFVDGKPTTNLYGFGFTLANLLEDTFDDVDRTDIEEKIKKQYFDFVIFSRIDPGYLSPYVSLVLKHYPKNKIVFLDGIDETYCFDLLDKGIYFKRELIHDDPRLIPISFAFPASKIQTSLEKTQFTSKVQPSWSGRNGYIYTNEQDYYDDYRRSKFGLTVKKAGWDCLRHYEIMGCRAIPLFLDLKDCPPNICTHLPKELLLYAVKNHAKLSDDEYFSLEEKIFSHFTKYCTTEAMAKYMLDKIIEKQN